MSFHRFFF